MKRVNHFTAFHFQMECEDPEKLIQVSYSLTYLSLQPAAKQRRSLTADPRIGR